MAKKSLVIENPLISPKFEVQGPSSGLKSVETKKREPPSRGISFTDMVGNILRRGSSFKSIGNSQKSESKPKKKKDKKKSTKKQKKKKKKKKDSSSESSHSLESSNSPSVSNSSDSSESKKKKKKKKSSGKDKKKKKKLSKKKFESESSSPESPNKIRKKALLRKISTVDHAILSKVMNRIDSEKEL